MPSPYLSNRFDPLSITCQCCVFPRIWIKRTVCVCVSVCRLRLKRDGTRAETRFRLSTKRTSPFKSAGGGGGQFSRLLAGKLYTSACRVCTARASLCSAVMWRLLVTHSILLFPLHFSSHASPCAITFQLDSTWWIERRPVQHSHFKIHAI
jgi:hypothetical protein